MKIAILSDLLAHDKLTGVENYLFHLVRAMALVNGIELTIFSPPGIPSERVPINVTVQEHRIFNWFGAKYLFSMIQRPKNLNHYDLIHCPTVMAPFFLRSNKLTKMVMTVHDLVPALYPAFSTVKKRLYYEYALKHIFRLVDHFIVPSQAVKNDLVKLFSVNPSCISVVYEGVSETYHPSPNKKKDYILAVSTIEPRKNFKSIIDAYIYLKKFHHIKEDLVIVGKKGWSCNDVLSIPNELRKNIIYKGYVPEKILIEIYQNAKLFVYPSFYEGFGLPVAEAMACGCPVVTSNVSSLPEVAEEAAIFVDPHNVNDIADAILRILQNENLALSLTEKGLRQVRKFSWAKCAIDTIKVYDMVLKG